MQVPFLSFEDIHAPIKKEMAQAFEKVYDGYWYIMGQCLTAFEKEYAEFNDVSHVIGVSNGLDALYLSLKALDIGAGDEVIVPSNSYIATLLAVTYTGAVPVLVEPDTHTFNLDPARIDAAITSKTKAVMPIHLFGQCCDMESILKIAKGKNLSVIEDNAQSHGSTFKGKIAGSWGDINGTSFYPGKNLGAIGDGGAVTTNNEILASKVRALRNYGSSVKYYNEIIGHNMRLDELQAAFLSVKLKYLKAWTAQRVEIASWYNDALNDIEELTLPGVHKDASHVYHLYVVRTGKRDELQQHLTKSGIGTLIHYPIPPHLQKAYAHLGFVKGDFPIAESMADHSLSLPIWPGMTKEKVQQVADSIKLFFGK